MAQSRHYGHIRSRKWIAENVIACALEVHTGLFYKVQKEGLKVEKKTLPLIFEEVKLEIG